MQKKAKKMTLDTLAAMVANGFADTATKADVAGLKLDIQHLESNVSDMNLRLDNLAPKFEVRDLEKRVTRLEERAGIRQTVQ